MRYKLEWDGGPGVIIDLQCLDDVFLLRYDGPMRLTLRRGVEELFITPDDLDEPVRGLRRLAGATGFTTRGQAGAVAPSDANEQARVEGGNLFNLVLPPVVAGDLGADSLFVEIGTDQALLHVPWELMCDATGFLALRHAVGRYVNLSQQIDLNRRLDPVGDVKVLVVSVANPQRVGETEFVRLPEADAEFDAIVDLLVDRGIPFVPLQGVDATKAAVRNELKSDQPYTIMHFTGHGHVDAEDPRKSGLVMYDGILTTGVLAQFLRHAPVLAFVNGCETAKTGGPRPVAAAEQPAELTVTELTRVFGIARPLLDKGSYVLGTRWKVTDNAAGDFAAAFYTSLLDGAPIGRAITVARNAVFDAKTSDLSWASYVFYGDPRLRITVAPTPAPGRPPSVDEVDAVDAVDAVDDVEDEPAAVPEPALPPALELVARDYEQTRTDEPADNRRTLRFEQLLDTARQAAPTTPPDVVMACLASPHEGTRIVGVVLAKAAPSNAFAPALLGIAQKPRSRFEHYQALVALQSTVDLLTAENATRLRDSLLELLTDEQFLGTDRAFVARETLPRIERHLALLGQSTANANPSPDDV